MPVLSCRRLAAIAVPVALVGVLLVAAPAQAQQPPSPDPFEVWRRYFEAVNRDWQDLVDGVDRWIAQRAERPPSPIRLPPEPRLPRQPNGTGKGDGGAKDTPTPTPEAPAAEEGEQDGKLEDGQEQPEDEGAKQPETDPVTALLGVLGFGGEGDSPAGTSAETAAGAPACDAALCPTQPPKDQPEEADEDDGGQITAPQFGVQAPKSADAFDAGIVLGPTVLVTTNPKPLDLDDRRTTTDPMDLDGLTLTNEGVDTQPGGLPGFTGIFDQGAGSTGTGWGGGNLDGLVVNQPEPGDMTKPDIFVDPGPQDSRRVGGAIDLLG